MCRCCDRQCSCVCVCVWQSMKFGRAATEIVNKLKADIGVEVSPVEAQTSSQLGTVTLLGVPVFLESIMGALIHDLAIMVWKSLEEATRQHGSV